MAVLVRQRWTTLAGFAFVTVALQVLAYGGASTPALAGFGALTAALALGLEANRRGLHAVVIGPEARPRPLWLAAALLALGAAVLALAGWDFVNGERWLAALAVAHIALGLVATRVPRISRELALIAHRDRRRAGQRRVRRGRLGVAARARLGLSAIPFAGLLGARRPGHESRLADLILGRPQAADRILALAALAGQLSLAAFHGLVFDARPTDARRAGRLGRRAGRGGRDRGRRLDLRAPRRAALARRPRRARAGRARPLHRARARGCRR